ncbi:kit ligand isoform X1 [Lates japonicus]|uniref:Kit ligand isoform X1 n=1 Tax=Lates japonicus TaxID=270547 RepID=A0AAD3QYH0_LATJO|nr:kit ligand isoform X1 [Lates japonicus]
MSPGSAYEKEEKGRNLTVYVLITEQSSNLPKRLAFLCPSASSPSSSTGSGCLTDCKEPPVHKPRFLPVVVERSLLSLLFIPLLALVFLLVWKVRSRRNEEDLEQNPGAGGLFTGTEGTAPPLDEISEKNKLNVIETV